jgi:methylated-DNA-protein-cysteine methyltransferase-like protein
MAERRARARATAGSRTRTDRDERQARILAVVDCIPRGRVASYGQVAREAGLPRHARLVGRVLACLPSGSKLAWHRVVNSAGRISLRPGSARQRRRLQREGVHLTRTGRIDLARFRWTPADDEHPTTATR